MDIVEFKDLENIEIRVLEKYLLEDFFLYLDVSEKTMATYRRALKQLFRFFTKNNISNPTYADIQLFKKELERINCKSAIVALYLASTRRFFSWCEQKNIYPNVANGVKAPRQDRGHKRDFFLSRAAKNYFIQHGARNAGRQKELYDNVIDECWRIKDNRSKPCKCRRHKEIRRFYSTLYSG